MASGTYIQPFDVKERAEFCSMRYVAARAHHHLVPGHRERGGEAGRPRLAGEHAARLQAVSRVAGVALGAQVEGLFFQVPGMVRSVGEVAVTAILFNGGVGRGQGTAAGIQSRVVVAVQADLVPSPGEQAGPGSGVRPVAVHAGPFGHWGMNAPETVTTRLLRNIIMTFVTEHRSLLMQHGSFPCVGRVAGSTFLIFYDWRVYCG